MSGAVRASSQRMVLVYPLEASDNRLHDMEVANSADLDLAHAQFRLHTCNNVKLQSCGICCKVIDRVLHCVQSVAAVLLPSTAQLWCMYTVASTKLRGQNATGTCI